MLEEPPEQGWESINRNHWRDFGKTDEVLELLRHLPYIQAEVIGRKAYGAPDCEFADWQGKPVDVGGQNSNWGTEPYLDDTAIPPHIVGLTMEWENGATFLLDTQFGVIYWYECPIEVCFKDDQVEGDGYGWADDGLIPEDQVDWRCESGVWAIKDFFEMLKRNFEQLNFVPVGSRIVNAV